MVSTNFARQDEKGASAVDWPRMNVSVSSKQGEHWEECQSTH